MSLSRDSSLVGEGFAGGEMQVAVLLCGVVCFAEATQPPGVHRTVRVSFPGVYYLASRIPDTLPPHLLVSVCNNYDEGRKKTSTV